MHYFLIIILTLWIGGCATARHEFAPPAANWKTTTGQLRYSSPRVTFIGDFTLLRGDEGLQMEFGKGPGLVLMRVFADSTHVAYDGPLARGRREFPLGKEKSLSKRIMAATPENLRGWAIIATQAPSTPFSLQKENFFLQTSPSR